MVASPLRNTDANLPSMASLFQTAQAQRAALIRQDAKTAAELARRYRAVHAGLTSELKRLYARMDRATAKGQPIGPAMLFQEGRLGSLLEQVDRRVAAFAKVAERNVTTGARSTALEGLANGAELVDKATPSGIGDATPSFNRLRDDALNAVSAQAGPVSQALAGLAAEERRAIEATLIDAVGRGRHPREVARVLERITTMPLNRALTIARTEQLRAYRNGSHLTYRANEDVLQGWVWISAADGRTCAACFAMHGSLHTVDETLESHPNCRCVPAPHTRPWSDFGFPDDGMPQLPTDGPAIFRTLPKAEQERILGKAGAAAYRRGEVTLRDFIATRTHPLYGQSIGRSGVQAAKDAAAMRRLATGPPVPL